jgi:NAD(P)-dependent dehydrogenase (short-subunit alcohol dehydrogenase family)
MLRPERFKGTAISLGYLNWIRTKKEKLMDSFKGKAAFVTGGTSGIGRATAIAFARAGALVAVVGRRAAEGQETLDLLRDAGGDGIFIAVDLAREKDVMEAIEQACSRFGQIDFAANCAGIDLNANLVDYTEAEFNTLFDVNVKGLFFCLKHQILAMKNKGGVIINVSSVAAQKPFAGNSLYNASKSAAAMLTRTAAVEAGEHGIRIIEVAPGPIDTPMLKGYLQREAVNGSQVTEKTVEAGTLLGRIGRPEDVANVITFLCSPAASFVTATSLNVDGGFSLS